MRLPGAPAGSSTTCTTGTAPVAFSFPCRGSALGVVSSAVSLVPLSSQWPVGGPCPCYGRVLGVARSTAIPLARQSGHPWIGCPNFSSRSLDARPGADLGVSTGWLEHEVAGTECGPSLAGPGADCRLPFCFGWYLAATGCALLAPSVLRRSSALCRPACTYFSGTCEASGSPLHPPLPAPRPFG